MGAAWEDWTHIVKVDPDKSLVEGETYEDVCATGTDAIAIGGTTGITAEKLQPVIDACATYEIPIYQEPNQPDVVVDHPGLDGYLVPTVFNAGDPFWVTGAHKEWVRITGGPDWERTTTEAYIVLNPDSAVATYTDAECDLPADHVAAYATVAEQMFGQEIIYIEYSGTFGDPDVVSQTAEALETATLFYGGGVHDYESAYAMGEHADVVVVGDLVHETGVDAVADTVAGANDA